MKTSTLFCIAIVSIPSVSFANEHLQGPVANETLAADSEFENPQAPEAYWGHYICGYGVNVRGPIQPGGYAGSVIGTAYYGETVALQGQSYTAWVGGYRQRFVRVHFQSDGAYGYVAPQFVCRS
jgi:hypothetical protein